MIRYVLFLEYYKSYSVITVASLKCDDDDDDDDDNDDDDDDDDNDDDDGGR